MKKMFKKVVATALAAVMTLGAFIGVNPSVAKADLAATVGLHIGGDAITTVTVTGDGQYTLSYSGDAVSAGEWGTMYFKQSTTDSFAGKGVKIVSIKLNGESYNVPSAWTTFNAKGVTADNIIDCSFYNQWAADLATMNIGDTTGKDLATLAVTSAEIVFEVGDAAATPEEGGNDAGDTSTNNGPVQLTLLNDGQVRAEGDPLVYRVNIFNSWTNDANDILTKADSFNGATKVEVTFTVSGLGTKTGKAGINMSNSDWGAVQYWFDGKEYAAVTATDVEIKADGTYTVALATTGENKFDTVAFMDLQTDIVADEGEKDLTITSGIDIKIDKIVVTGGTDTPVDGVTPEKPEVGEFDPAGKYNAYLGLQTPNWTYRNAWNDPGYTTDPSLWGDFIYGNETKEKYGKVTDAKVEGNGTYSVKVVDFGTIIQDDFTTAGKDYFNLLFVSTDIPLSDDIKITNVKLVMDGKTIKTYKEAFLDPDEKDYVKILLQNEYNDELKETLPFYNAPSKSIALKFTIEGFNYDNEDQKENTTTKAPANPGDDNNGGGLDPVVIVVIVVAVVAIVAGAVVVLGKKNKKN